MAKQCSLQVSAYIIECRVVCVSNTQLVYYFSFKKSIRNYLCQGSYESRLLSASTLSKKLWVNFRENFGRGKRWKAKTID